MNEFKKCSKCGKTKPLDEFHNQKRGKYGKHPYCKKCSIERNKKYRQEHREEIKKQRKKNREEHREEIKKYRNGYYEKNHEREKELSRKYLN